MDANSKEISAAILLGNPCFSKNLLGLISKRAIKKEKASGASISLPTYSMTIIIMKTKSGLSSLEKTLEVEEDRQIPIH